MAVGPLRALLSAHFQASWNRTRKELGKGGTVALVALSVVLVLFVLLPALGGSAGLGYLLGRLLGRTYTVPVLGLVLTAFSFGGGLVGGIAGGPKALTWESYRIFPLRLPTLFAAELVAGLGDLLQLLLALVQGAFLLGLAIARPALLPLVPVVWVLSVGTMLCVQHLVGGLAAVLVKRLQVGLVVLGVLLWAGLSLGPLVAFDANAAKPRSQRRGQPAFQPEQVARFEALAQRGARLVAALPQGQAAQGLRDAAEGRWGQGLLRLGYLALAAGLLAYGAARTLAWESQPQALEARAKGGGPKPWSFRGPVEGLGRLAWETVLGSHIGKFGFLIPLMTLVLVKGPFAHMKGQGFWVLPGAFAYLSLTSSQMLYNQFGLYGHGIKALLLLPVQPRHLLLGQTLGLAVYLGIQALLLMGLLALTSRPTPTALLAALCLGICYFFTQAAVGHWTSVAMPRAMPRDSLKNGAVPFVIVLITLGTTFAASLVFGGAYTLCAWLAPTLLLPVMAALAGLCGLVYWMLLPQAAAFLAARREKLLEALG